MFYMLWPISNKTYMTEQEAACDWADTYRKGSMNREFAAFIYSTRVKGEKRYGLGGTYPGMRPKGAIRANVIFPFVCLYLFERFLLWLRFHAEMESFIHTHPEPPVGYTMKQPSREDLALLKLPGIKAVYVIPFENGEVNRMART